jgi:hypothetical protein
MSPALTRASVYGKLFQVANESPTLDGAVPLMRHYDSAGGGLAEILRFHHLVTIIVQRHPGGAAIWEWASDVQGKGTLIQATFAGIGGP